MEDSEGGGDEGWYVEEVRVSVSPLHPPTAPPRARGSRGVGGGGGAGAAHAAGAGHSHAPRHAPPTVRFVLRTWLGASDAGGARFPSQLEVDAHTENGPHGSSAHARAAPPAAAASTLDGGVEVAAAAEEEDEYERLGDVARLLAKPLTVRCGGAAVPHPDKIKAGSRGVATATSGHAGEDAYFVAANAGLVALGVSDGVYMWRTQGIDAGLFSRGLCAAAAAAVAVPVAAQPAAAMGALASAAAATQPHAPPPGSIQTADGGGGGGGGGFSSPLRLLARAYADVLAAGVRGSATACFLTLDPSTGVLRSANIGDAGYLLMSTSPPPSQQEAAQQQHARSYVRAPPPQPPQSARVPSAFQHPPSPPDDVKYRSPHQEHEFGRPYQLGHHAHSDTPRDAMLHAARVAPGDAVVMGTDGLWDNLHDAEIGAAVAAGVAARHPPAAIARAITAQAFERSIQRRGATPYSTAATDAFDMVYSGGKPDDIAVLVVLVSG